MLNLEEAKVMQMIFQLKYIKIFYWENVKDKESGIYIFMNSYHFIKKKTIYINKNNARGCNIPFRCLEYIFRKSYFVFHFSIAVNVFF